jgi:heptosyltransferase I
MFEQSPPESICVIRLSAIGDTCHALAVVRSIQDTWPETPITWIIGKTEASLMADIPDIEFIIFDKSKGRLAYADVRNQLVGRRFDIALCMHASLRANLLCRLIPTPIRLGFDFKRARDFQWLFTNQRIKATPHEHAMEAMLGFARHIGIPQRELRWDIPLSAAQREFAAGYQSAGRPILLISPCSSLRSRNFRNWSAENYAAAANHARNKFDCQVILTGGDSELEVEYGRTISKLCDKSLVNLIGKTSLKELFAMITVSQALICPDSGPAHMATAAVPEPRFDGQHVPGSRRQIPRENGRRSALGPASTGSGGNGPDSPGQRQSAYRPGFFARFLTFVTFPRFYEQTRRFYLLFFEISLLVAGFKASVNAKSVPRIGEIAV